MKCPFVLLTATLRTTGPTKLIAEPVLLTLLLTRQLREVAFCSLDATSLDLLLDPTMLQPSEVRPSSALSCVLHRAARRYADCRLAA